MKAGTVIAEAIVSGKISKGDVTRLIATANKMAMTSLKGKKDGKTEKKEGKMEKKEKKEKCSGGKCHHHHKSEHKKSAFDVTKIVSSVGKKTMNKKSGKSVNKTARVQKISPRHCAKCNSLKHDIRVCPDTVTCGNCGIRGHNSRGCNRQ